MPFETTPSTSPAVAAMKQRLSHLETEEGRLAGLCKFQAHPNDVFVVTPPKCGTTLVCQILHSLRSKGDMSFEEINLVIPCLEMAWDYGYRDLNAIQPGAPPQCYKTHAWRRDCPWSPDARYIYVVRDPVDAAPSFFHFLQGWFFEAGDIGLDEFIAEFMMLRGAPESPMQNASHWHNLASWYPHRRDSNVLFLFYEDISADLAGAVGLIAQFLQLGHDDPELQAVACAQASIDHMRRFPSKYDEHMLKLARNEACGLPLYAGLDGVSAGKVRKGGAGGGKQVLNEELLNAMKLRWDEVVAPVTGYESYEELRAGVNAELGRTWDVSAAVLGGVGV